MKKLIVFALVGFSLLGLSACGTEKENGVETTQASAQVSEAEKNSISAIIDEASPTQKNGEYTLLGLVKKSDSDYITLETEKGTEILLPSKNIKIKLNNGDNVLAMLKMDISKVNSFDDITVSSVIKL